MTRNFVLAFGGTGARCAEAFAYLMASRAVLEPCHVLMIDPDQSNGNVDTTRRQLQRYLAIHQSLSPTGAGPRGPFFQTDLNESKKDSFSWGTPGGPQSWESIIGYRTLTEPQRQLLDLLYDEGDLALTFENGYIGRANIGSLDLLETLKRGMKSAAEKDDDSSADALQLFYRALRAAVQGGQHANLVVFGSIFGGTGASGLPALPPLLKQALGEQLASRVNLACVQVAPYFTFPDGRPEDPDSALHPLATQNAMRHYAVEDVGYDRVYLVGAPDRPTTATLNAPGGSSQQNTAHYVELSAALAAAHLFRVPPDGGSKKGVTELFAASSRGLAWDKLPYNRELDLRRNLVALAALCASHLFEFSPLLYDGKLAGGVFEREMKRKAQRSLGGREGVLKDLDGFAERYLAWIRELQDATGAKLFTLGPNLTVDTPERITDGGKRDTNVIATLRTGLDREAVELGRERDVDQESGFGFFLATLTRTIDAFVAKTYASWIQRA